MLGEIVFFLKFRLVYYRVSSLEKMIRDESLIYKEEGKNEIGFFGKVFYFKDSLEEGKFLWIEFIYERF